MHSDTPRVSCMRTDTHHSSTPPTVPTLHGKRSPLRHARYLPLRFPIVSMTNTRSGRSLSNNSNVPPTKTASGSAARAARASKNRASQHRDDSRVRAVVSRGGPVTRTASEPSAQRPQHPAAASSGGPPLTSLSCQSNHAGSPARAGRLLRDKYARPVRCSAERRNQ